MSEKKKFYITTAIEYTSRKPHIGNAYDIVLADMIARYKRMQGYDVFLMTGSDEHGQKIEQYANEAGISPKEYVDNVSSQIKKVWDSLNTSYNKFIRTTDEDHVNAVKKIFKKLYDQGDIGKKTRSCCSADDIADARSVCARLGIDHYVFNMGNIFHKEVIDRFISGYQCGLTPNPCIDCNKYVKFDALLRRAGDVGCWRIATGHYARIEYDDAAQRILLKTAADDHKDQTYFLYSMTQEQLARVKFPLGGLTKPETRRLAEKAMLTNARKPDSQDICFVPDGDYAGFIERTTGQAPKPGDFLDTEGRVIGQHRGLVHYTVGQRKGLGFAFPEPHYVCSKDAQHNTVTIGTSERLFAKRLLAGDCNWIAVQGLTAPMRVQAKIRYGQKAQPATLFPDENGTVIEFDEPQRAISPGQATVWYDGDVVVGGGTIIKSL